MSFQCKKLEESATVPKKSYKFDAGFDLYTNFKETNFFLKPGKKYIFSTGISVAIPEGWYGRIAPRSGFAMKGIDVLGGVVDCSYRGEIKIILINHGEIPVEFKKNDRIAQLILEKCGGWELEEVKELGETKRGESGFGSTGN